MKTKVIMVSLMLAVFADQATGQSDKDVLKQRFLAEYPAALEAWETRVSEAEGTVRLTGDVAPVPPTVKNPHRVALYSFKCKMPEMAWASETSDREGLSTQRVRGYNKKHSFALRRSADREEYSVESLEDRVAGSPPPNLRLSVFLSAPYAVPIAMKSLITLPRFSVRGVSPVVRDGKKLLRIEFDAPAEPVAEPRKGAVETGGIEGSLLVSPEEKWVLYTYECRSKKANIVSWNGTIDYEGSSDGFPIPKQVTRRRATKRTTGESVETETYDFLEFRLVDLPDKDFTLAAFGIPEQVLAPSQVARRGRLGYLFLGLALVALAAAFFFKIALSRISRRSIG